jgi:hypothetical protein
MDADRDGMPDGYEFRYFGSITGGNLRAIWTATGRSTWR